MTKKKPEDILVGQIITYLHLKKIFCWKHEQVAVSRVDKNGRQFYQKRGKFSMLGVPDILGWLPDGKFLGIEVKMKGKDLTASQRLFHGKAKKVPVVCFVAKSLEDVQTELKNYL